MRGRYLRLLAEVPVFHRGARRLLASPGPGHLTFGEFLRAGGFSDHFVSHFARPLVSAVWSCPARTALSYPASYLTVFPRLWEFYLAYSEAGFRSCHLDVRQILLTEGTTR